MPDALPAPRRAMTLAAAAGLLALAGCGGISRDDVALAGAPRPASYPGSIALTSSPPGARCVLTNTATHVAIGTVTTPAEVALPRSSAIIEARCSSPRRMNTVAMIRPVRDFAPDIQQPEPSATAQRAEAVGSGRTRRYLDTVVVLPPAPFASAAARDAWFAERAEVLRTTVAPWIARAERAPDATIDTPEMLGAYLAEDLARLNAQKAAATLEASRRRR